jgi:hypothetical protein
MLARQSTSKDWAPTTIEVTGPIAESQGEKVPWTTTITVRKGFRINGMPGENRTDDEADVFVYSA